MGLDLLEFTLALEKAFGIAIPDDDAVSLTTPGEVVDYLERRFERAKTSRCFEQRAFYRVRRALGAIAPVARRSLAPSMHLEALMARRDRRTRWESLGATLGAPTWPSLAYPSWFVNTALLSGLVAGVATFWAKPSTPGFFLALAALGVTLVLLLKLGTPLRMEFLGEAATLGTVARHLATHAPAWLKGDDRSWTRTEIERVVRALMVEELGISKFKWTDRFVKDLGCS